MARDDIFTGVRQRIRREMTASAIPSFAVAVARDGEIVWEEAFGWADRERMIPATPHTMYSLASVSKPVTTTALMVLVERGEIDLDRPVNDYLPADCRLRIRVGDPAAATVRRLAGHTCGLGRHENFFSGAEIPRMPTMPETIRRYGVAVTPPGERYRYSNLGYGILDFLVETVSGTGFADFLRREVFLPLGMTRSSLDIGPGLEDFAAARYEAEGRLIPFYTTDHRGASNVYASAHDLVRFGLFHLNRPQADQGAVLRPETVRAMQAKAAAMGAVNPADLNLRRSSGYGLGWVIDGDPVTRVSHGGGMGGVATKLLLLPVEGIVVAALANTNAPLAYTIEEDILATLLPGRPGRKTTAATAEAARPALQAGPAPELLGDWRGKVETCEGEIPLALSFRPSGEVYAKLGGQLTVLVNEFAFDGQRLTGRLAGNPGTADAVRRPWHPLHHLQLDLALRGGVINGALVAVTGNALSHWVELKRT